MFTSFESALLNYLINVAPVVVLLGISLAVVWREYLLTKKKYEALVKEIQDSEKINIEVLEALDRHIKMSIEISKAQSTAILETIKALVTELKIHIDSRFVHLKSNEK